MKHSKSLLTATLMLALSCFGAKAQWAPQGDRLKTDWAQQVDPKNTLPEYPRPLMQRQTWKNLNGLWQYAITDAAAAMPAKADGNILVPFALESSLSGVMKTLPQGKVLWYKRTVSVPSSWRKGHVLLHFGAVDYEATVYVNGSEAGQHVGGYSAFTVDITPYLKKGSAQTVEVKVIDNSDDATQAMGKQRKKPEGIWYTTVTGIWQTVWMEPVAKKYVADIRNTADIDAGVLKVALDAKGTDSADKFSVRVLDGKNVVAEGTAQAGEEMKLNIPSAKLWSPENPFLYSLQVSLKSGNKTVDSFTSYAAMRKISTRKDANDVWRIQLNNKDIFPYGPLDQGYWPDGLYTAPTDEALVYDVKKTKDMGFNMIRKHMKVEPARWYTYCDQMGLLVWQDMPSIGRSPQWINRRYFDGKEITHSPETEARFQNEWKDIINEHYSNPSIVVWTPFNEAWGQALTEEVVKLTETTDPTRLVDPASGGNHYKVGSMLDLHNYPGPDIYLYDNKRPTILGEYGGLGYPIKGHLWKTDGNWGYVTYKNSQELTDAYVKLVKDLMGFVKRGAIGLSAGVYTQTTDVEGEVNGLMTYDRKVIKMDEKRVREVNTELCNSLKDNK